MQGIQKECLGKFNENKAKELGCYDCTSLNICLRTKSHSIKKQFIRLETIEDNDIRTELIEIKKKLDSTGKKTNTLTIMAMLKHVCLKHHIKPSEITLLHINDYLETKDFGPSTIQPKISMIRGFTRDILQLKNWNSLGIAKTQWKHAFNKYNGAEFLDSQLYKDFLKHWERYTTLRKCNGQHKGSAFTYQRRFIHYCYKNDVRNFDFESLKPHIEPFLTDLMVADTSYKTIWTTLKILFESAFDYSYFKYDIPKPKSAQPKLKPLPTEEEIERIFKYLATEPDIRWYPLMAIICYSSVRIEKITNLTWNIVDLEHGYFRLGNTKTGDRDKRINFAQLVPILKKYKIKHNKLYKDNELLFPDNDKPSTPIPQHKVREKLIELGRKLNIPYYPPNNWRAHICIKIWINSDHNYAMAKEFMGHDTVEATERYIRHYRSMDYKVEYDKYMPYYNI